jgi:saccharopine dehydrogenase-like NADP-dependent oxidoreductase
VATWSIQTFADEFTQNAMIFENGELREVPAITLPEPVVFPPPIGEIEAFTTLHSELATFPSSFKDKGIRNVNWKEGGPKGWHQDYQLLEGVGLLKDESLRITDQVVVSPRQFFLKLLAHNKLLGHPEDVTPDDWECSRVEALGRKNGKITELQLEVLYSAKKEWKASCAQYGVGIPASIVTQMLGDGRIEKRGVIPPENCVDPTALFKELEGHNMHVTIRGPAGILS